MKPIKIQLINKKENTVLCTADVLFGLDTLIVESCDKINKDDFEAFLKKRSTINNYSYEMDEIILKKLVLYYKKNNFGRMDEACVLYAMLCNFEKEDDDLAVYPLMNTLFTMFGLNPNYTNLYTWRTKDDTDAWEYVSG